MPQKHLYKAGKKGAPGRLGKKGAAANRHGKGIKTRKGKLVKKPTKGKVAAWKEELVSTLPSRWRPFTTSGPPPRARRRLSASLRSDD